jgi:subfamily B ATP-binding cassette protein MsbA
MTIITGKTSQAANRAGDSPPDESSGPLRDRQLMARIFGYVRPHMRVFAVGVLGMILTAATEPALPALFKVLLDDGFGKQGANWLVWALPVAMVMLFVVRGVFTFTMS